MKFERHSWLTGTGAAGKTRRRAVAPRVRLAIQFTEPGEPATVPIRPGPPAQRQHYFREIVIHFPPRISEHRHVRWLALSPICCVLAALVANAQPTNSPAKTSGVPTTLIEAAGQVEYTTNGTNWQRAAVGLTIKPGDRVRTRAESRAAVQLSDRSVIRLSERTTLEILPPRQTEKKRFGLRGGSLYFFNREKPADVEFDTPLAAGAIRGTEFLLEVAPVDSAVHLALIDGLVVLQTQGGEVSLHRGEDLRLSAGQPPQKTALVNAKAAIQWALYYPAVLNPDELNLSAAEQNSLRVVLEQYRAGDLLAALAAWPANENETGAGIRTLHAQLELAVGRVNEAEELLRPRPIDAVPVLAIRELIAVVRGDELQSRGVTGSASVLLAHSYALQARGDLAGARVAARRASELAPLLGFAQARRAELEFAFGNRRVALAGLDRAIHVSPRLASAHALRGFILLDAGSVPRALAAFDRARELDAAYGPAWLGRGLCLLCERRFADARSAFQAAAALEPQRGLFRAYLGKAAGELGETRAAEM